MAAKRNEQEWRAGQAYWLDGSGRAHDPGDGHAVCGSGEIPGRVRVFSKAEALRFNVDPYSLWRDMGPPPPKPPPKKRATKGKRGPGRPRKTTKTTSTRTRRAAAAKASSPTPKAASYSSEPSFDLPPPAPTEPAPPGDSVPADGSPDPSPNFDPPAANDNAGPPPEKPFKPAMVAPLVLMFTTGVCAGFDRLAGESVCTPANPTEISALCEATAEVFNRRLATASEYDDIIALVGALSMFAGQRGMVAIATKRKKEAEGEMPQQKGVSAS